MKHRIGLVCFAAAGLVAIAESCSSDSSNTGAGGASAECQVDTDCDGNAICDDGECVGNFGPSSTGPGPTSASVSASASSSSQSSSSSVTTSTGTGGAGGNPGTGGQGGDMPMGICTSGLTFQLAACDVCLSDNCCTQFTNCAVDQQACIDCLNGDGPCNAAGNAAINCLNANCSGVSDCDLTIPTGSGGAGGA